MASILGFANMPSTSRRVPATRSYALRASASSIEPHQARPERTAECTPPLQSSSGRAAAAGVAAMAALLPAAPALALAQQQPLEQALWDVAELDSATAGLLLLVLKPLLTVGSLLMVARIVMTWYPEIDGKALPWSIAYLPTEGVLAATRRVVKPFNGLDVSPIVWVALLSLISEVLTGPQGILSLIERKGI